MCTLDWLARILHKPAPYKLWTERYTLMYIEDEHCTWKLSCQYELSMTETSESQMGVVPITFWTLIRCSSKRQISHQSIAEVDDEVSDVTSEPGTSNDNKPITASRAKGHTLNNNWKHNSQLMNLLKRQIKYKIPSFSELYFRYMSSRFGKWLNMVNVQYSFQGCYFKCDLIGAMALDQNVNYAIILSTAYACSVFQ